MKTHLFSVLVVLAAGVRANDTFTMARSVFAGGGGATAGAGEFTLTGSSIGQFSAGDPSNAPGEFDLTGGYWTFELGPRLPDLHFSMVRQGGTVTLSWDVTLLPVRLDRSEDLQLWQPVVPQPPTPFFQEPDGLRRFYRLVPGP